MPVVGITISGKRGETKSADDALRQGLAQVGYIENQNLIIEWRYTDNNYDNLSNIMTDLVARRVAVIAATGSTAAVLAAKAATQTIPIVFMTGVDPVEFGLVEGMAHPGGNLTGVAQLQTQYAAKRIALLHELTPSAAVMALLTNPTNQYSRPESEQALATAKSLGIELHVINAINRDEIEAAFPSAMAMGVQAIMLGGDALFYYRASRIAALASHFGIPVIGQWREYPTAGGLISYGNNILDALRLIGVYVGRILKGEKPADMPVQQPTKFELVINVKAAKALGLSIPDKLLATADEVIE
jgi:putative ABC transport system substrate-binding protein